MAAPTEQPASRDRTWTAIPLCHVDMGSQRRLTRWVNGRPSCHRTTWTRPATPSTPNPISSDPRRDIVNQPNIRPSTWTPPRRTWCTRGTQTRTRCPTGPSTNVGGTLLPGLPLKGDTAVQQRPASIRSPPPPCNACRMRRKATSQVPTSSVLHEMSSMMGNDHRTLCCFYCSTGIQIITI
uniref:Uncharacterized protein n=1 Tax=Ciona savignyi TaxID=51511 RepID=H2YG97_CIOSA